MCRAGPLFLTQATMTALESGWPCLAASLESLTVVQVLTVTVTTQDTETVAKGSSELSLRSLNLVWLITGGPIPSKHTCAHTKHAVHV